MTHKKYEFDPVFDLNRNMLENIYEQFNIKDILKDLKTKIENKSEDEIDVIAESIFEKAGATLVENVINIGDKEENRDRGYQILREHCMREDVDPFPHLLQHFIEVLYLSINPKLPELGFLESSLKSIEFWIDEQDCDVYQNINEICGNEIAERMPCKYLCNEILKKMSTNWDGEKADRQVKISANMSNDQMCKFAIVNPGINHPKVSQMSWDQRKSKIAVINWDGEKCKTPMMCKKCLEICPEQVFRSGFWQSGYKRGVEYTPDEPGVYKVTAEWIDRCIGCMECVKVCPAEALEVDFPELKVSVEDEKLKLDLDNANYVLDFRKFHSETKKMFELGGLSDKLKSNEVLHIVDKNPLKWVEKRFRMLREGQFNIIEEKENDLYKMIVHRNIS